MHSNSGQSLPMRADDEMNDDAQPSIIRFQRPFKVDRSKCANLDDLYLAYAAGMSAYLAKERA